jgi:glycosylphosphatidylinositol transamidase (GPIT) subunit GPI8
VAVIVSSSRYWFNYRHVTNALSIYHLLKRGGFSDDNIVLMLADDIPCNKRNVFRGQIFARGANGGKGEDLMQDVQVDFSGTDVTVDAFLRVLLGRPLDGDGESDGVYRRSLPRMDEGTNVFVYLTGHGGDNFFKFQDGEELMSHDVASAFSQMYQLNRYNEILFISDTCQAFTMADEINVPNVFSVGSSLRGQNSYASHTDSEIGQSVIDRYSKAVKDFVDDAVSMTGTGESMFSSFDNATVAVMERLNIHDAFVRIPTMHGELGSSSQVGFTDRFCSRSMNKVPLSDFFAAPPSKRYSAARTNRLVASLWMNDAAIVPHVSPLDESNGQCIPQMKPDNTRHYNQRFYLQHEKAAIAPESPIYDLRLLAVSIGFTVFVLVSLGTW